MKKRKSSYEYTVSPIKETAQELLTLQAKVGQAKKTLSELQKEEERAIFKLVELLKDTKSKMTEVSYIQFKVTEDGRLLQSVIIR